MSPNIFIWILALVGLFLIYLDFFLPSGILAIGGSILLLGSVFLFHLVHAKFLFLIVYLLALVAAVYTLVRFAIWRIRHSANKGPILLDSEFNQEMVGKMAKAATDLKPSGHISIDDQLYQALSQTGHIDKGCEVTVIGGKGTHLIVQTNNKENR